MGIEKPHVFLPRENVRVDKQSLRTARGDVTSDACVSQVNRVPPDTGVQRVGRGVGAGPDGARLNRCLHRLGPQEVDRCVYMRHRICPRGIIVD